MAGLRLGPLLRYVDGSRATVWIEASRPCVATVRCAGGGGPGGGPDPRPPDSWTGPDDDGGRGTASGSDSGSGEDPGEDAGPDAPPGRAGPGGEARTFQIAGHHYALVTVTGLTPGTDTEYEVLLDGRQVWPLPESRFPPSTIRTPGDGTDAPVRVSFGSCRWAAPPAGEKDPVGPDALDTLAAHLASAPGAPRPDVLLLLGDQVYADETSHSMGRWLAARRDVREPPGDQVADYEEYTHLYYESWLDPDVRWLLSTVPSLMIFDDHDVIDDWNTSASWLAAMRETPWWNERILSGLMSYWVYQHLGNLSPGTLDADPLYAEVRNAPDGTDALRAFAARADADPASVRWSYRRDLGGVRLLMVDSRAARVLDEQHRSMLGPGEEAWLREQALDDPDSCDHLLIGTSLPWLLPPLIHDAESWDSALCRGERGARWARFGEWARRRADLEHWAAFPASFESLGALIAEVGGEARAQSPATVSVLSGDVHHAYVAEPSWPSGGSSPRSKVLQLTCSPVHNSVPGTIKWGFRFGWSRVGRALGSALLRHGRLARPSVDWHKRGGPWFGNQLMTLTLRGRSASLALAQARASRTGEVRLETVYESTPAP